VILYPAIDIRGGSAVRLTQGDYERETRYDADPVDAARRWVEGGARFLHVVDLDGARAGATQNLEILRRLTESVDCPVQFGGGLRDPDAVRAALDAGAERVVIGTAALRDPNFLQQTVDAHGDRVVVSVDARDGMVSLAGWTESSDVVVSSAVSDLSERGVSKFLCTAIEVDGTMEGPRLDELNRVASATEATLIASGGVGALADLEALAREAAPNVEGIIVGRALYEERFTVAEGNAALER
jgi:phosphoribosylformimino-5-aminoimidazole carboxamide ribotide isomerase